MSGNGVRAIASAAGLSTAGVLPAFLLGGLVVAMRADIDLDDGRLGSLVAAFFLASALTSLPGGWLAERFGVRTAVAAASLCSAAALAVAGIAATAYPHLLVLLVLAGIGNGIAQPTSNLVLARGVAPGRQGLAFGAKQAAIPAATLITGGAVAVLAQAVGWRWAYGGWAIVAVVVVLLVPADRARPAAGRATGRRLREGDVPLRPMLLLAVAAGLASAVGTSVASFFVASAVRGGMTSQAAGLTLTVASLVGITSRLTIGLAADRLTGGHFRLVLRLVTLGAVGFAGLAITGSTPAVVVAALLTFGAGWAWPGLFNFAVVRWNPNAPGAATAITQVGVFVGGVIGPLTFGAVATRWSFSIAWLGAAAISVLSGGAIQLARRALAAERRRGGARPSTRK